MNEIDDNKCYIPKDWNNNDIKQYLKSKGLDISSFSNEKIREIANLMLEDELKHPELKQKKKMCNLYNN